MFERFDIYRTRFVMSGTPAPLRRSWSDTLHAILHYDFCPGANRWVYWIKRPEASLALAGIAALACAIFVQPIAFVAFGAILSTLALGWIWPWLAIRGLQSEMQFALSRTTEQQPTQARLRIRNRWPWPVWGLALRDGFFPDEATSGIAAIALASVPGWHTTEFDWEFRPPCRGLYPFAVPRLTTGFPFGLVQAGTPVQTASELLVWPYAAPLDVMLDSTEQQAADDFLCEHRVGECGDFTGTRAFRQGDSLRRVHWAQTARQGRLIVTERQAAIQMAVRVVVDLDPTIHAGAGTSGTLEWAIRLGASVAKIYHQQHAAVECHLGPTIFRIASGEVGWKRFLDELARLPRDGITSKDPLQTCSHRQHEILEVVVTTDRRLEVQPALQHPCGRQRLVILTAAAFELTPSVRPLRLCPAHHWLVIESSDDVTGQFQRGWRRLCYEH